MPERVLVGYHGAPGALSEGAAIELFNHHQKFAKSKLETVTFTSYPELFDAVSARKVDHAIMPVESSHAGTIQPILDKLTATDKLHITGEYKYSEPLCLLGVQGSRIDGVREISSHPALLEQTKEYIERTFGDKVVLKLGGNSATCANSVKQAGKPDWAVIGGPRAAQIYGLQTLAENITGDAPVTRYLLVSAEPAVPERHEEPKTSVAVTLRNTPGAFFKAIACFAMRDVNITKMDTRPAKAAEKSAHPWEYILHIDVDGAPSTDQGVARALDQLREFAVAVKVLGSYQKYQAPAHKPMGQFGEIGM